MSKKTFVVEIKTQQAQIEAEMIFSIQMSLSVHSNLLISSKTIIINKQYIIAYAFIGQCLTFGIYKFALVYYQARLAQAYGAIGLILFPDPVNLSGPKNARYPQSWEMPAGAIARGSIGNKNGDPLTPLYPAKGKEIVISFIYIC